MGHPSTVLPQGPSRLQAVLWRYACFVAIISGLYLLYARLPYYQGAEFTGARGVLTVVCTAYLAGGVPFFFIAVGPDPAARYDLGSKTLLYLAIARQGLGRLGLLRRRARWRLGNRRTKTALLSLLVKAFYLPVMTMFLCQHAAVASEALTRLRAASDAGAWLASQGPHLLVEALFFIDTAIFTFGYAVESPRLRSRIKSVEPTLLGWAVTLICYPPFNTLISSEILPHHGVASPAWLRDPLLVGMLGLIALACQAIFVWASINLGFKASNLTNRGIVTHGPYRWVRHPAYTVKLLGTWCTQAPTMTPMAALALLGWHGVYFLRAWTEERHLLRDPDYQRYCRQVRFRFIPHVW